MSWWTAPCDWPGETAFIVGGGPSVLSQPIELLRGRRVIVINSSFETVPFADYLICFDPKWWETNSKRPEFVSFKGRIINPSKVEIRCSRRLVPQKINPPGLAREPNSLAMRRTTLTAAINLAAHQVGRGGRIVLLGADGKRAADGRSHHHVPHAGWKYKPLRWGAHHEELATLVAPLREMNIDVVNASPGSAWADLWPVMSLQQAIERTGALRAARHLQGEPHVESGRELWPHRRPGDAGAGLPDRVDRHHHGHLGDDGLRPGRPSSGERGRPSGRGGVLGVHRCKPNGSGERVQRQLQDAGGRTPSARAGQGRQGLGHRGLIGDRTA